MVDDEITVLVTSIGGPAGFNAIRSLRFVDSVSVVGVDADPFSAGHHFSDVETHTIPLANEDEFVPRINELVAIHDADFVLPCIDEEVVALAKSKEDIKCDLLLPSPGVLEKAHDKYLTIKLAKKAGIPHPNTWLVEERFDIDEDEVGFPLVVKPRRSRGARGVRYASNFDQLNFHIKDIPDEHGDLMIQEFIPGSQGNVYTAALLFDYDSSLKRMGILQKIREKPPSGGVAVAGKTIRHADIMAISKKLMEGLEWKGPASIEFKVANETPYLMEINPRLFGYHYLLTEAGINLPEDIVAIVQGDEVSGDIMEYETDLSFRRLPWDVVEGQEK